MKIYFVVRKANNSLVNYFYYIDNAVNYIKTIRGIEKYKIVIITAKDGKQIKESYICKLASNSGYDISDW